MLWLMEKRFWLPSKNDKISFENIRKLATDQGNDYKTGYLLDYSNFKENHKMIAIDLTKQQALDADPRAMQQVHFMANSHQDENARSFFLFFKKQEKLFWTFHKKLKDNCKCVEQ